METTAVHKPLEHDDRQAEIMTEIIASYDIPEEVQRDASLYLTALLNSRANHKHGNKSSREASQSWIWVACAVYLAIALHDEEHNESEASDVKGKGRSMRLFDLLAMTNTSVEDLGANMREAMQIVLSAFHAEEFAMDRSSVSSPRSMLRETSPRRRSGRNRTSSSLSTSSIEKHGGKEGRILDDLEEIRVTNVTMSRLFKKFEELWDVASTILKQDVQRETDQKRNDYLYLNTWWWFLIAYEHLRFSDEEPKGIVGPFKLLVGVIYLARFAPKPFTETLTTKTRISNKRKRTPSFGESTQMLKVTQRTRSGSSNVIETTRSPAKVSVLEIVDYKELAEQLFEFAKLTSQDVLNESSRICDVVQKCSEESGFSEFTAAFLSASEGLQSSKVYTCLTQYYVENYINQISCFDPRVLLMKHQEVAPSIRTPVRPFDCKPVSPVEAHGSVIHRHAKKKGELGNSQPDVAANVTKSLFGSSSMDEILPTPLTPEVGQEAETGHSDPQCYSPRNRKGSRSFSFHAQTPVSSAVEASNWLARELEGAPNAPSEKLLRFYSNCTENPQHNIEARLLEMKDALEAKHDVIRQTTASKLFARPQTRQTVTSRVTTADPVSSTIEPHLLSSSKLYFRVLESILRGESERVRTQKFDVLLHSDMFHRALFVCCVEIVFRSMEVFRVMYPVNMECLNVPAFELLKVLANCSVYFPMLPSLLRSHISSVETNIIEETAWASNSPVFALLEEAAEKKRKAIEEKRAFEMFAPLKLFLLKVWKLAHEHSQKLCNALGLTNSFPNESFCKDVLTTTMRAVQDFSRVLEGRCIDHVIVCTIYAVAKVREVSPEVTFKRILGEHRKMCDEIQGQLLQPFGKLGRRGRKDHYAPFEREIRLDNKDKKKGDIVAYYNQVFIPPLKIVILDFKVKASTPPKLHHAKEEKKEVGNNLASPKSSGKRLISNFSSPRAGGGSSMTNDSKRATSQLEMTPRTRVLYAHAESPAVQMQVVNNVLTRRTRIRRKVIEEQFEGESTAHKRDGPSTNSMHRVTESPQTPHEPQVGSSGAHTRRTSLRLRKMLQRHSTGKSSSSGLPRSSRQSS